MVSTVLEMAATGVDAAREGTEQVGCFVCSDGPGGGPRVYAGAAAATATATGPSSVPGSVFAYLRKMARDFRNITSLVAPAVEQTTTLYWEGVNADMDRETATNPTESGPDRDDFTYDDANWLKKTMTKLLEKWGPRGSDRFVGTATDTTHVMYKIGETAPAIRAHHDRSADALDVIAEERAKANPTSDSD